MPTALFLLIALIGMAPAVLFFDGPLALGIWSAVAASALVVIAQTLKAGDATHFAALVRPLVIPAAIPAIVIVVQALPLPAVAHLANPIWESAAAALGRPLAGSVSIDTGATLLSLCRYLAWLAVGLLAGAVTVDRQRAEWVLFAATSATVIIAALLITNAAAGFAWFDPGQMAVARGEALDGAALGIILSAACAVRAYERFETRRADDGRSPARLALSIAACAGAFVICAAAIALADPDNSQFAAAVGLATLVGVVFVRRLGLGQAGALVIAVVGYLLLIGIVAVRSGHSDSDLTLRFAAESSRSKAITQRMLADGPWFGAGTGTYRDLVPIYRDHNDSTSELYPPSAAAEVAVELGRPLLWAGVLATIFTIVMLLRAALRRGRDSFYPAAGAGALVMLLISAFGNAGLFGSAVLIISGAVLGLALAQSRSRIVQ